MNSLSKVIVYLTIMSSGSSARMCSICEDGTVPRKSDVLLKFFPGTLPQNEYTCKELHFLGMFDDGEVISPDICTSLARLASFACGCGNEDDQRANSPVRNEPQDIDVTITGASNDVIVSSTFVESPTVNSTKTMNAAKAASTTPTMTPSPKQDDISDFPSTSPSMAKETSFPSVSPTSKKHKLRSSESNDDNFKLEEETNDGSGDDIDYRSILMEIFDLLKSFLFPGEHNEEPHHAPANQGKLRGM